jgi:hypothetical protein
MAAFALFERRWEEFAAWLVGMAIFVVLFITHLVIASHLHHQGDVISTTAGWINFSGWIFVIQTERPNLLLADAPGGVVATWACLSVIGLAGARSPWLSRAALIVGGYMTSFLFVGLPFNNYWGLLYAFLAPIGVVFAPASLRDLIARAIPEQIRSKVLQSLKLTKIRAYGKP